MSAKWPLVSLGELLRLERRPVVLKDEEQYQEIGIYCFGKGIFHKQPRTGFEVGDKDLFALKKDDFILQITFAWEGAVAVVSEKEEGMYGSTRYPTFRVDEQRCLPHFLQLYFRTEQGRNQLVKISPGSAGRNRVLSLKRIPEVMIPLPPLAEQRRLVARIEAVAALVAEAQALRKEAVVEAEALLKAMKRNCFPAQGSSLVGDVVSFQTGYAFKSEWFTEEGIRLARNANVGHGVLDWRETVRIPIEQRKDYPRFELNVGDVLISLDRPIISTGVKVARVRPNDLPALLLQRVARAQMKTESLDQNYFFEWLRSPYFEEAIDPGRSNGVPHISHKDIEKITFTVPDLPTQRRIVRELDALQAQVDALKALQAETQAELDGLMGAVLGEVFGQGGANYQEPAGELRLAAEP